MTASSAFTMGVEARCTDGVCGHVAQVVLDPVGTTLTHLIIEPVHREARGRLVPVDWVTPGADHVDLRCTIAEFDGLPVAEAVQFLEGVEGAGESGYATDDALYWPYYEGEARVPLTVATVPMGEVAVQRGEQLHATDGWIGEVEGLVVDGTTRHVSHVLLKEGHLFGRKEVAVPIEAVASVTEEGIRLSMTKHEVSHLPAVDFRHPGRSG
jgi:sporulation protein YlmC with PRC-barrel domain